MHNARVNREQNKEKHRDKGEGKLIQKLTMQYGGWKFVEDKSLHNFIVSRRLRILLFALFFGDCRAFKTKMEFLRSCEDRRMVIAMSEELTKCQVLDNWVCS